MLHAPQQTKHASRARQWDGESIVRGYRLLLAARREAPDPHLAPHAGAVPLSRLRGLGMGETAVLWMMYQAHLDHLLPAPGRKGGRGVLRRAESLHFLPASSFLLTEAGAEFAADLLADAGRRGARKVVEDRWGRGLIGRLVPRYNKEERVFSWGAHLLKCFRQPAGNQELILAAAEELGWPEWFDDPLPRAPGTNPKRRLHDTIQDLNRRQRIYLVHFKGEGNGTGIGWEYR